MEKFVHTKIHCYGKAEFIFKTTYKTWAIEKILHLCVSHARTAESHKILWSSVLAVLDQVWRYFLKGTVTQIIFCL